MKNFTIWFLSILSAMCLVVFVFAMVVDAEEKYQCFAELYPKLAEKHQIPAINKSHVYDDGTEYFLLSECKNLTRDTWFLWFDISNMSPDNKLDGFCDMAVSLLFADGELIVRAVQCDHAYEIIYNYCIKNKLSIKEFVH